MIIDDDSIYKRIQRYREEENKLQTWIRGLSDVGDTTLCADPNVRIAYENITAAVSLLRTRKKEVKAKIELLKNKLSPNFWNGRIYDKV